MTNVGENLVIMDGPNITFGKQHIPVSKSLAALLSTLIIACMVTTGLVVYYSYATTCPHLPEITKDQYIASNHNRLSKSEPIVAPSESQTEDSDGAATTEGLITTSKPLDDRETKTEVDLDLRLPNNVIPVSYKIDLIPFIVEGNFTFHGNVTILMEVVSDTTNIVLHADNLTIESVSVYTATRLLKIRDVTNDTRRNFLTIELYEYLLKNHQYYVNIVYKGVLNDLLIGFYRSSYMEGNEKRWIAVTQFQTTDARRAFPCFDEPALKAKFQLNIARTRNMTSLSNMRKLGNADAVVGLPDYVWDHFEESVPMSTYLLAFVVCDFDRISQGRFSVWARKSAISQSTYSLDIGPKLLNFYEHFFGIEYPLPKMDMIALPDFSAGAMENWGLITFRESLLLFEEGVSGTNNLQSITQVVAHELAHQWFGNLVTPVWWSDLWLNEGFATFAEYEGSNAVSPDWKILDQFIIYEMQSSMFLDALKTSHQISVEVNDPDEISNIFDRISYSKGAAIIRMMQHFLTEAVFRKGLTKYLKGRVYDNAEQDDLWEAMTQQSHTDNVLDKNITVKEIMDTWTLQTGFPIVSVTRNRATNNITFTQKRFRVDSEGDDENVLWWIPLTITDSKGFFTQLWMSQAKQLVVDGLSINPDGYFLVNVNFTGYYRVNYELDNWDMLTKQLTKPKGHLSIDPKNRAQILDDAFSLSSAGLLSYDVALNISKYLTQEREFVPWQATFTYLDYIRDMFEKTAHFDKYKAYLLRLMESFCEEIGYEELGNDPVLVVYNRIELLRRSCLLGSRKCLGKAIHDFQNWRNSVNPDKYNGISPNLREIVYCTAVRVGGQEEWDFLWDRYGHTNVGSEREVLLDALGCSSEVWILSRYLEWTLSEHSGIRKQDIARVFAAVASKPVGKDLAYKFMKTNWDRIKNYLGSSSMALSGIIRCTTLFNTKEELDDFKLFISSRQLGIAERSAQQTIEQGEANIKWMGKNFDSILKWLVEFSKQRHI